MTKIINNLADFIEKLEQSANIDCGTTDLEGVSTQAELFAKWFKEAGFYSETVDLGPQAGKGMFASNAPHAEHYDLLLSGHLDTVFPKGSTVQRPFHVEENKAFGCGVSDMKDGDLTILWALSSLDKDTLSKVNIAVCLNPDEETGSIHSHEWIDSYAKRSDFALVFESGNERGVYTEQRKGIAHIDIFLKGVGAHAGFCPELGRSAVDALAQCIIRINALRNENVTVNFGVVDGGTIANAIAENAHARIDVRFWTNEQWDDFYQKFKAEFEKPFGKDVNASYNILVLNQPMLKLESAAQLRRLVNEVLQEEGLTAKYVRSGGISDGNHISQTGTPVLDSFGPIGGGAHTVREWLDLNSVEPAVNILKKFIKKLANQ